MRTSGWTPQQLAEFVVAVSAAETEASAALTAVERAAEAFDADVAAIVSGDDVVAAVGYPEGTAPVADLKAVRPGDEASRLDVPGAGRCRAAAAPLDQPPGATLVVARPGIDGLTPDETGLLRGMARVASMAMRMLHVLDDERAAREELERLADEQAALRRVATLVAEAAQPERIHTAVAAEIAQRLGADVVTVLRYDVDGTATIVGGWGVQGIEIPVGVRLAVEGEGAAVSVLQTRAPVHTEHFDGPPGSVPAFHRGLGISSGVGSPIVVEDDLWGVAVAGCTRTRALPAGSESRIAEFTELVATAIANTEARGELRRIADEQAALRRVATLVARGVAPTDVFNAVAAEVGTVLGADFTLVSRYDDGVAEVVGGWSKAGGTPFVGKRTKLGGRNVTTLVFERNEAARVDFLADDATQTTSVARESGARSSAGAPISIEGRLWGVMIVASAEEETLPAGSEHRLADFTELVATALANTQAREDLRRVADEQAALRRVATLVARASPPADVFAAVAEEVGQLFAAESELIRYDPRATVTTVGSWSPTGHGLPPVTRLPLGGHNVATRVFEIGRAVRIDRYRADDASAVTMIARQAGGRGAVGAPIWVAGRLWGAALVMMTREGALPADSDERLADFAELVAMAVANAETRGELRRIANEQAALRRVATLVARGVPPRDVFATVAQEIGRLLSVDRAFVVRYDAEDTTTVVAAWSASGEPGRAGFHGPVRAGSLGDLVRQTRRPARTSEYAGEAREVALSFGIRSAVGAPVTVEGRLWGYIVVGFASDEPPPLDTEARVGDFTELLATAVANAEAQAELTASRARIVASADETRRRIERDLHDGAQQRLVALALQLRAAQASVPPDRGELAAELDAVAEGLKSALDELREFARGIHPALLAEGGLAPALKALARRSAVPVELEVLTEGRLPEPVEVGAYYVVSEALTNVAKHAEATTATVHVEAGEGVLRVDVRDDGVGGAKFAAGSGLVGLRDRVEALGGRIALESDRGVGTMLSVELPVFDDAATRLSRQSPDSC